MIQADSIAQGDCILGVHINNTLAQDVHLLATGIANAAISGLSVGVDLKSVGVNSDTQHTGQGCASGQLCSTAVKNNSVAERNSSAGSVGIGTGNVGLKVADETFVTFGQILGVRTLCPDGARNQGFRIRNSH